MNFDSQLKKKKKKKNSIYCITNVQKDSPTKSRRKQGERSLNNIQARACESSKLRPRNLETSLRVRQPIIRTRAREGRGGRGEGAKQAKERNLTYQLASRSEGLTPRGPLTVRRFVFEVWEPRHGAYSRFTTSSSSLSGSPSNPPSARPSSSFRLVRGMEHGGNEGGERGTHLDR